MAFVLERHPLILEIRALNDLLRELIRKVPKTHKKSGELDNSPARHGPGLGIVSVPGSGDNSGSLDQRGPAFGPGNPGTAVTPTNNGPSTQGFQGLPGGGGSGLPSDGGGGW